MMKSKSVSNMKKLSIGFFLFLFNTTYAQVEIHLNGGIGINSRPYHEFNRVLAKTANPVVNIALAGDALYNYKGWQFGIGLHVQKMSSRDNDYKTTYVYGNPAFVVSAIANRKVNNLYFGVGLGYLITPAPDQLMDESGATKTNYGISGNGVNANLHTGYSIYFGKFGINGQVNGNCAFLRNRIGIHHAGSSDLDYGIWYFHYSLLFGVSYKL